MVKAVQLTAKHYHRGRKRELIFKAEGQVYARIEKALGSGRYCARILSTSTPTSTSTSTSTSTPNSHATHAAEPATDTDTETESDTETDSDAEDASGADTIAQGNKDVMLAIRRGALFLKKVYIRAGDIVLLTLRAYQPDRADIAHRYTVAEVRQLQALGELPSIALMGDVDDAAAAADGIIFADDDDADDESGDDDPKASINIDSI
jgi:translation initiation factor 1A